jgi:DNA-nicking Smr family endonuclease
VSGRKLKPEELELWKKVARTTDRMHAALPEAEVVPDFVRNKDEKAKPKDIPKFQLGQKANGHKSVQAALPVLPTNTAAQAISMDKKAYDRLKRGKLKPQGRIDLHGMTLSQAQPALTAFIMSSFAQERRLVLVITGKGKEKADFGPIPERPGVLRRNVPHWLQTPPLAQMILQVTEAHDRHGGWGAYYVYLRRRRK